MTKTKLFIEKALAVHGDRYDYSLSTYKNRRTFLTILCCKHGRFDQSPAEHLRGRGCPKCAWNAKKDTPTFIIEAMAVHGDRYDYSESVYKYRRGKLRVICDAHGEFMITPSNHITLAQGCPKCPYRFDEETNLYLMANNLGQVKVGFSIAPELRLGKLNRRSPFSVRIVNTWAMPDTPTARKAESEAHRELVSFAAGMTGFDGATEWFNTTPEHVAEVVARIVRKYK